MNDYIAWLDHDSVARGTLREVERKAREVFNSEDYQRYLTKPVTLRITRGARQLLAKSIILRPTKKNPVTKQKCSRCGSTYYVDSECPICQANPGRGKDAPFLVSLSVKINGTWHAKRKPVLARNAQEAKGEVRESMLIAGRETPQFKIGKAEKVSAAVYNRHRRAWNPGFFTTTRQRKAKATTKSKGGADAFGVPNPSMFGPKAIASAKRVTRVRRVRQKDTGELGEIIGSPGQGWLKVKWDNRQRPTLIKRSEIVSVRAANPRRTLEGKRVTHAVSGKHVSTIVQRSRAAARLRAKGEALINRAYELRDTNEKQSRLLYDQGMALVHRAHRAGDQSEGPVGTLPNPKRTTKKEVNEAGTDYTNAVKNWGENNLVTQRAFQKYYELKEKYERERGRDLHKTPHPSGTDWDKSQRKNPSVTDLARTFQGKASGAVSQYKAANSAPSDLARIGKLVFLELRDVRRQIAAPGAMVAVDTNGKLWLTSKRAPMFTNKAQPGSYNDFGEIERICYLTAKTHIGDGKLTEYVHTFGEDGGALPRLLVDHEGMPILRGGDYKIRAEGIVN